MFKNVSIKLLLWPVLIMLADLVIKVWLINTLPKDESISMAGGVIAIHRITTTRMALGIGAWSYAIDLIHIAFQVAFVLFFVKVLRSDVHKTFALASAMIVAGWIGLYLDRFLFSVPDSGYRHMDYIIVMNNVTSLTSLMIMIGWTLLLLRVVIRFEDLKVIFKRA